MDEVQPPQHLVPRLVTTTTASLVAGVACLLQNVAMRLDELRGDIRYLLASVRRSKGFFATAVLTFGLGIGATTAMLSAAYGVLLRPLPYPESERLVQLWEEHPGVPASNAYPPLANTTFYAWRTHLQLSLIHI